MQIKLIVKDKNFVHKNLLPGNFFTQKFLDLRYVCIYLCVDTPELYLIVNCNDICSSLLSFCTLQLQSVLLSLTGEAGFGSDKSATFEVELGGVDYIHCDTFNALREEKHYVQLDHPVVADAMRKGKTLFIISALYQSKKCKIKVSWTCSI